MQMMSLQTQVVSTITRAWIRSFPNHVPFLIQKKAFSINTNILMGHLGDKTSTFEQISSLG
jgi:hypothetical protein